MTTLKLIQFSGEIPRLIPRLLADGAAQRAENVRLDDGGLTPVRKSKRVHTIGGIPAGDIKTIYKHGEDWLAWSTVVNAAPGSVAEDRLYYTGDGVPKMRVAGTVYPLAVPFPATALTATLTGTPTGSVVTQRYYAFTYVTDFGEESEPCPLSNAVNWVEGNTVTLSGFPAIPTGRNITKQRIYRLQQTLTSGADLFFITERTAATTDYVDSIGINDFGEVLPSRDWNAPPDGLQGLISLPNGMMAGFVGKALYFCEPYRPHAYPEKYVLTMDYPIVALVAYGSTIIVMTTGTPTIVSGSHPDSMIQEKTEINLPCINARGVVDLGYAIAYPSHDGLVIGGQGQAPSVVTGTLMTRQIWQKTNPATFVAGQYNGRYFASYEYIEANGEVMRGTFIIDLTGSTPFLLRAATKADAMFYDVTAGTLNLLVGTEIYEWDAFGEVNEIMTWRSKQFILPAPASFGAILIEGQGNVSAEEEAAIEAERLAALEYNATIFAMPSIGGELNGSAYGVYEVNGDMMKRVAPKKFTSVRVVADNEVIATISDINVTQRLPPVDKTKTWEVIVNGNAEITQITIATTPRELNVI